jgi:tetratricopeptide (TPR) repeat protein
VTRLAALLAAAALAAPPDEPCPAPVDDGRRREALLLFRAGAEGLEAQDWEEAERRFAAALRIDPVLPLAHYGRGQAAMGLKRYPEAVSSRRTRARVTPTTTWRWS